MSIWTKLNNTLFHKQSLLIFLFYVYVSAYMFTYVWVHMWVQMCIHMCMLVDRGQMLMEVNDSLSTLSFEASSLSQTQISLTWLVSLVSLFQRPLVSAFWGWTYPRWPYLPSTLVSLGESRLQAFCRLSKWVSFCLEPCPQPCQVFCCSDMKLTHHSTPSQQSLYSFASGLSEEVKCASVVAQDQSARG